MHLDLGMIRKQDKNTRHQKRTTFWIVFHQITKVITFGAT